jgi:pathogenesis-related protein 1
VTADAILITKELIVIKSYYLTAVLVTVLFAAPAAAQLPPTDQDTLNAHNTPRRHVSVKPVEWDTRLAQFAQQWADTLANRDIGGVHRDDRTANPVAPGQYVGENIFWGDPLPGGTYSGADAVNSWVTEKSYYNNDRDRGLACYNIPPSPPAPGCSPPSGASCGHYCQVVWSNTQLVGCGKGIARDGTVYIVCNYYPAGNFANQKPY